MKGSEKAQSSHRAPEGPIEEQVEVSRVTLEAERRLMRRAAAID